MQATEQNETTQTKKVRLRGFIKGVQVSRGYCFVHADDGSEYFLQVAFLEGGHKDMVKGALVEFTPIPINIPGKCDRAVKAVVLSRPAERTRQPRD